MADVPTFEHYMAPIVESLRRLGGSASISELYETVVDVMALTDEQLSVLHNGERGNQTEAAYRMAWARTYLRKQGYIENSERGVWALTPKGRTDEVDGAQIVEAVRAEYSARRRETPSEPDVPDLPDESSVPEQDWRLQLMEVLLALAPDAFERLCQRILRESGFVEVRVLGRTGDGGIDGIGILRIQRVVSFQVLFQCKRWRGTVGAKEIRDFRGAMVGRSDKGLFITTGTFSRGAQEEATRDGAPPIDLIDGEQLLDLLRELRLGLRVQVVEQTIVEASWFDSV